MTERPPTSSDWPALFSRFRAYGQMPTWGWFKFAPDPKHLTMAPTNVKRIRERGTAMVERAEKAFEKIRRRRADLVPDLAGMGPEELQLLYRESFDLVGKRKLKNFWDAVVFDLDDYRCTYCRRSTFETFENESERRGLFLVIDHRHPKTDVGATTTLSNLVTACWSCNTMKGRLPVEAFRHELRSLAAAVLASDDDS